MKRILKLVGILFASIFAIALFSIISPVLLVVFGFGIWYYLKKEPNPKRMKMAIVGTVISLFGCFALIASGGETDSSKSLQATTLQGEVSSDKEQASSATSDETTHDKLVTEAKVAVERTLSWPSRSNLTTATKLVGKITNPPKELAKKLSAAEEKVVQEENNIKLAEEAILQAENTLTQESYENAKTLLAVVITSKPDFSTRLATVESSVAAAQAEADRVAAEQAAAAQAEADRVAAEQAAAAQAEADRVAAEQAAAAQPTESVVYIAPQSGTKYHYDSTCRGLKTANSIISMTVSEAQSQGYTLCGYED